MDRAKEVFLQITGRQLNCSDGKDEAIIGHLKVYFREKGNLVMQCYHHIKNMAYGICTECGKGVCKDCFMNNNNILACSVECSKLIIEKREMNERGKKLYGIGQYATLKRSNADWISMLLLGLTFTLYGSYITYQSYINEETLDVFLILIGFLFLLISFLFWKRGKKFGLKL